MDAARAEPGLGDGEATSFFAEEVALRNPHAFEMDSRVARVTRDTLDDGSDEAYFAVEYINPSPQDQKLLERFLSDMEMFREELEAIESAGQDD